MLSRDRAPETGQRNTQGSSCPAWHQREADTCKLYVTLTSLRGTIWTVIACLTQPSHSGPVELLQLVRRLLQQILTASCRGLPCKMPWDYHGRIRSPVDTLLLGSVLREDVQTQKEFRHRRPERTVTEEIMAMVAGFGDGARKNTKFRVGQRESLVKFPVRPVCLCKKNQMPDLG